MAGIFDEHGSERNMEDIMRINSGFWKHIIDKVLAKAIKKKLGVDVKIHLDYLCVKTGRADGVTKADVSFVLEAKNDDIPTIAAKLIKED